MTRVKGFTLLQVSILLAAASMAMVAMLPSSQSNLTNASSTVTTMNAVLTALRQYQVANGFLPCPADPTQPIGSATYGIAAANGGTTNNCIGGNPAAAYADTGNHIAIGMVPVRTLGLSNAYALDGFGRDITYAVDTNATTYWPATTQKGAITVSDNGATSTTVVALISHGADGFGAWIPLAGSSGVAARLDNGSTDSAQAANAQVNSGGGLNQNTTFQPFVRKPVTSTFDDIVVYQSPLWNMSQQPLSAQQVTLTPPANGLYGPAQKLTFQLTFPAPVTVNTTAGTPSLLLQAISGSIGNSGNAYASYVSGSGTNTLTFQYTPISSDSAPTGITVVPPIALNGGTLSLSPAFTQQTLSGVILFGGCGSSGCSQKIAINYTPSSSLSSFPLLFSGTFNYLATQANNGVVANANGYDIFFTNGDSGCNTSNKLAFEQESYNSVTGQVSYWIKVPTVSTAAANSTVVYLCFGNAATTNQSNKNAVWDSNYKVVYHMGDSSGTVVSDSTANNVSGTVSSASAMHTTGKIGSGFAFSGSKSIALSSSIGAVSAPFTIETWFDVTASSPNAGFFGSSTLIGSSFDARWINPSRIDGDIGTGINLLSNNANGTCAACAGTNAWHHLAYTVTGGVLPPYSYTAYLDGTAIGSGNLTLIALLCNLLSNTLYVGQTGAGQNYFTGSMDEFRVSASARSAAWIAAEYANQNTQAAFPSASSAFLTLSTPTAVSR